MKKDTYKIIYELGNDGWWIVSAKDVEGCHSQGKSIEEARTRIREALSLWIDNAETAELEESFIRKNET